MKTTIKSVFEQYSPQTQQALHKVREQVFDIAKQYDHIGSIEETLKWNQPSYLTVAPKSGTTLRLSNYKDDDHFCLLVHCQTTLIEQFKEMHPSQDYETTRAIIFSTKAPYPEDIIGDFIYATLTYHTKK